MNSAEMQVQKANAAKGHAAFHWDDPFLLEDQLTSDERAIRDTARRYAQDSLQPRVIEAYLQETTDRAIFSEMGGLGLLGTTLPQQYGGAGASYVAYGLVAREIERVDSGLPHHHERAGLARPLSDPRLWRRAPAPALSAAPRQRRVDRLFRPDRAGGRVRSGRHEDAGREGAGRLSAQRRQDLDHQCADRRCIRRMGAIGRAPQPHPRFHPRAGA